MRGVHDSYTRDSRFSKYSVQLLPRVNVEGGVRFIK
jgi:hypothetical protein